MHNLHAEAGSSAADWVAASDAVAGASEAARSMLTTERRRPNCGRNARRFLRGINCTEAAELENLRHAEILCTIFTPRREAALEISEFGSERVVYA